MKGIERAISDVRDLMERDRNRDDLFVAIDKAIHHDWDLPSQLPDKANMRKFTSSDASDAVKSAKQSLSDLRPQFIIPPMTNNPVDRQRHNKWEKALKWLFWLADNRQAGNITNTIISNAIQYGYVAGKVIYLPHEIKARKVFGGNTKRLENAMRYGPFAIENYNPLEVHTHHSDWMLESIVTKRVMSVQSIIEFWGELAGEVKKQKNGEYADYNWATLYDYHVEGKRYVWADLSQTATLTQPQGASAVIMDGVDTDLPFLPYFARYQGTQTPGVSDVGIDPMLRSVVESGQWDDQNLYLTMNGNNIIRKFYRPQIIQVGGIPLQVNYDNPAQPLTFTPSAQQITANPEQPLDPGMQTLIQSNRDAIHKSTVSEMYQTGNVPGGIGVGTVQQLTQNTTQGFTPIRKLAEDAFSDMGTLMLQWIKQGGEAYSTSGVPGEDPIMIEPALIDDSLYTFARLVPDLTADVSMANAALLSRQAGVPEEIAFEMMGLHNYEELVDKRRMEQLDEAMFGIRVQEMQAESQLKIEAARMQMQMQLQQAAMQPPQQPNPNDVNAQRQQEAMLAQQQGQGQNPAMGAESPINNGAMMREEAQAAGMV